MKKICTLFFTIGLFISPQIVKASDIKDATLKDQGKQNEASTIAWLQSVKPDASLITMSIKDFNKGFVDCITEFNQKYKTFATVTSDVINDEVIPELYTANLDPNKLYTFSYWNVTEKKYGRWVRKAKPGETGLFYPGWDDEPIMSVYCWNFGYPSKESSVKPKAPVLKSQEPEYVYIPGKKTVITYGPDTVEKNRSRVEINNNDFKTAVFNNRSTYEVDMTSREERYTKPCNHKEERSYTRSSCGCDERRICEDHYEKLPNKHKKKFFNTAGGRIISHTAAAVGGYFLGRWIFRDNNSRTGQVITQGPLDPLPSTNPIYTQAGVIPL
ncbi:hypothetical protein IT402_03195 [Candidatus Nomurabacteria bacterium]|nr:hypothetical protein [Candidatus Nomurabacteria bacterium]